MQTGNFKPWNRRSPFACKQVRCGKKIYKYIVNHWHSLLNYTFTGKELLGVVKVLKI